MTEDRSAEDRTYQSPWERAGAAFTTWRAGDATGVDELVAAMTPALWHVVRAYGLDRQSAEDVIATTWLGFVRLHRTIDDPQAVASWLITSARRGAADHGRKERRTWAVPDEKLADALPDQDSAETLTVLDDEAARLWRAVGTLEERCRRLLRVIAFHDRPDYRSLSDELDMPMGSIGPTRARCLEKLRTAVSGEDLR